MKVVSVHNRYRQPGGEDQVFSAEADLLERFGHEVLRYEVHNDATIGMGRLALATATIWNERQYRHMRESFRRVRPDIVHVHNTLPLVSPAVYQAARAEGAAVVQTLHNYRLVCPSAVLYREGAPCERCLGRSVPWPGVVHACYRGSRSASGAVATMLTLHRWAGTYRTKVDQYVALTSFARTKFIEGGLAPDSISVKPNFVSSDPAPGHGEGGHALFVGRFSEEKGILDLLEAWRSLAGRVPLRIVGQGPLREQVERAARTMNEVVVVGQLPHADVLAELRQAAFLVFPSVWYEGMPVTILEAFAAGTPVVASRLGAMAEIVDHERTGLLFTAGDPSDLASQVSRLSENAELRKDMRRRAREEHEAKYTAEHNHDLIRGIYARALERRHPS